MRDNKIAIYIPNYNGSQALKDIYIPQGVDCVVMDNSSFDDSETVCKNRGFIFVKNMDNVARTLNWLRCIDHFKKSGYDWMKWLFIGDQLTKEAGNIMKNASDLYCDSALIIFDYMIMTEKGKKGLRHMSREFEGKWTGKETLKRVIEYGNIFGAPIGIMISRKAKFDGISAADLEWSADTYLHMQLSQEAGAGYFPEVVGTFIEKNRKTFNKKSRDIISRIEDLEVERKTLLLLREKYPEEFVNYNKYAIKQMELCLEDNVNGFQNNLTILRTFVRSMAKDLKKKIEGE